MGRRGPQSAAELFATAPVRQARATKRAATPHDPTPPPSHLSAEMQRWWAELVAEHEIEAYQLPTLQAAAESWDRKEEARKALAKHGLSYIDDKGMIRARPECAIERDSRTAFLRAVRELGLHEIEPPPDLQPAALF